MKNYLLQIFCICLFFPIGLDFLNAQHECGQHLAKQRLLQQDPFALEQEQEIDDYIYRKVSEIIKKREQSKSQKVVSECSGTPLYQIPVVIRVIHGTGTPIGTAENVSSAWINTKIQQLNDGFRHASGATFSNSFMGVDTGIEFCLAKRDGAGSASSGITRDADDVMTDDTYLDGGPHLMDSYNTWSTDDYINVFITSTVASAGGYYSSYNGGAIVMPYTANEKTWIHEFGHYFSLIHTFGPYNEIPVTCEPNTDCLAEGDRVCDTPPHLDASCITTNNSCTNDDDDTDIRNPYRPVGMGGLGDVNDIEENYMSYGNNSCRAGFTVGQKDRMVAQLLGFRSSLLESKGCIDPSMLEAGIASVNYPSVFVCSTTFSPIVEIENNGNTTITSIQFDVESDGSSTTSTVSTSIAPGATGLVTLEPVTIAGAGSHSINFEILQLNGGVPDTYTANNYICHSYVYQSAVSTFDYCEDVEDGNINADFIISNPSGDGTFEVGNSTGCAADNGVNAIRYYSKNGGTGTDDALLIPIDLTQYESATLVFDVSYKRTYTNRRTWLDVGVSNDCGSNFTTLYNKTGSELESATPTTYEPDVDFVPDGCDDWRTETIDLSDYAGCNGLVLRFLATLEGSWGQNLYLDNICISGVLCSSLTNTSTSPGTITYCGTDTQVDLTVGNHGTIISDPAKEVIGWWITKDNPITSTAIDKATTQTALSGATIGGALSSAADVVYEGDGTTGDYALNIDCNNLTAGSTYYATPFVSGKEPAIADQFCNDIQGTGAHISVNSGDDDGSIRTVDLSSCNPTSPPNSPTFTLTVNLTSYTETLPASISLRLRNGSNDNLVSESYTVSSLPLTLTFTEADFPVGYDPNVDGMRVFFINFNSPYTAGSPTIQFDFDLDITYPGQSEITFPTIDFSGCVFGPSISFDCGCVTTCTSASPLPNAAGTYTSTQTFTDGGFRYYCDAFGALLLGIDDTHAANVADNAVQLNITSNNATFYSMGTGFINANPGAALLDMTWDATDSPDISSDASVRFFLPDDATSRVNTALSANGAGTVTGITDFSMYKVVNPAKAAHELIPNLADTDVQTYAYAGGSPSTSTWDDGTYGGKTFAEFQVSSFSGGGAGSGPAGTPLPVELTEFFGRKSGDNVHLYWTTLSEINSDYFVVERSRDGNVFTSIGRVESKGFSNEEYTYDFIDKEPFIGFNYYRLIQVDLDGTPTIYGPIQITFGSVGIISLYPVPSKKGGIINIQYDASRAGVVQSRIMDISGKLIRTEELDIKSGLNELSINADFGKGMFLLEMEMNGIKETRRIVIH